MAITSALCTSYKLQLLSGVHLSTDTYKIALYTSAASLDASTATYSSTNEVPNGSGYTTGGATLSGFATSSSGTTAWLDWTSDPSWPASTITARGCLIYNSTQGDKAVAVIDFGSDKTSTSGTFTVVLPTADATNALIRLA